MANIPEEFPIFTKLDIRQITVLSAHFKLYLKDFSANTGINDIIIDNSVIIEICERIEKRRIYFHIFYNCKMGELNEGALMCFWIVKLMPFSHRTISAYELNSKVSQYLFNNVLVYWANKHHKKINTSPEVQERFYYSLRYRDISKESIMLLAESLLS
jgi:hypothetical protein